VDFWVFLPKSLNKRQQKRFVQLDFVSDVFAEDGNKECMVNKIILLLFKVLDF
jgi:hypothetical protein